MTDRDDTQDKTGPGPGKPKEKGRAGDAKRAASSVKPATETLDWKLLFAHVGEPASALEPEARQRFEKMAGKIISHRLGVPLKKDGTPDISGLTQEQLDRSMPDLPLELLGAYLKVINPALGEKASPEGAKGDAELMADRIRSALGEMLGGGKVK